MENKNIHQGHRERLTNLVSGVGLENVTEIQALEWVLTLVFPRSDVNPLAHRLLDKFGNFSNIIDASIPDLCKIEGINERSAKTIHIIQNMIFYYSSCKMQKKISLKNNAEFLDLLEQLLRFRPTENLYLLAIDHSWRLIQKRHYDLKQVGQVGINPYDLYDFISSTKPRYLLVVHNHPNGTAMSSKDDHEAVKYIESLLQNLECKLLDSCIVGKDGIFSEKQNAFLRKFEDNDQFLKVIK